MGKKLWEPSKEQIEKANMYRFMGFINEKYKKEIGGDISEGKRTLMVVHCLQNAGGSDRKRLISILKRHTKEKSEISEAIKIISGTDSVEYARKYSENLIRQAKESLAGLPDSKDKRSLVGIADYVIKREL